MYILERELADFSAAHRLINGYKGKCQNLHGHNYSIIVTLKSEKLDNYGFVTDFSLVKQIFDNWVQDNWDHATLVIAKDISLIKFLQQEQMKHYIFYGEQNTTAEVLAKYLLEKFNEIIIDSTVAEVVKVKVTETSRCTASYSRT